MIGTKPGSSPPNPPNAEAACKRIDRIEAGLGRLCVALADEEARLIRAVMAEQAEALRALARARLPAARGGGTGLPLKKVARDLLLHLARGATARRLRDGWHITSRFGHAFVFSALCADALVRRGLAGVSGPKRHQKLGLTPTGRDEAARLAAMPPRGRKAAPDHTGAPPPS